MNTEPLLSSVGVFSHPRSRERTYSGFRKGIFRNRTSSSRRFRYKDLKYELILYILGEFFLLRTYTDLKSSYDVLEFYGYFLKDYDRNNYLIFKSVCASRKYELYYIPCLELQYFEFDNITTISQEGDDQVLYSGGDVFVFPVKYFEICDYIEQLVNVHLTVSILKYIRDRFCDRLTRLDFYIRIFNDDVLDLVNKLKNLKRLKVICTKKMEFSPYLTSPQQIQVTPMMTKSMSFHDIRPAQVQAFHQQKSAGRPRGLRNRHIFSSSVDDLLDDRYSNPLHSKSSEEESEDEKKKSVPIRRDLLIPNLRHLEVHRCISKHLFMSDPFSQMPNLRTLKFCHISKLNDAQINILLTTKHLENLYFEKVYLEEGFIQLLSMKNLKRLSFRKCTYNYNKISRNFRFEKERKKKKKQHRNNMGGTPTNKKKSSHGFIKKRNKKSVILSFSDSDDTSSDTDSDPEEDEGESSSDSENEDQQQNKQQQQQLDESLEKGNKMDDHPFSFSPHLKFFEFEYYCGEIFKPNYNPFRKSLHELKRSYSFSNNNNKLGKMDDVDDKQKPLIEGMEERALDTGFLHNALQYYKNLRKLRLINCNLTKKHFDIIRKFKFAGTNILIKKRHSELRMENNKIYEFYKKSE